MEKNPQVVLETIITFFADAFNDYEAFMASDRSALAALGCFANLSQDLIGIIIHANNLPAELRALDAAAIENLVAVFAGKLKLPNDKAEAVLHRVVELVDEGMSVVSSSIALAADIRALRG